MVTMRRLLPFLVLPALAACVVVGTPVVLVPGPAPTYRDVFADTRSPVPGSAAPSAAATPGRKYRTGRPLDVAIAGPGYFALSSRPDPRDWADVTLSRGGEFYLEPGSQASPVPGAFGAPAIGGDGQASWTLQTSDGRYVLGWDLPRDPDRLPPPESRGTSLPNALALGGPQAQTLAMPLRLPAAAGVAPEPRLDFRGRLSWGGQNPTDADGQPRWLHVAVVMVEEPAQLLAAPGGFRYDPAAGAAEAGIPGLAGARGEARRPVGDANALEPGYLETLGVYKARFHL